MKTFLHKYLNLQTSVHNGRKWKQLSIPSASEPLRCSEAIQWDDTQTLERDEVPSTLPALVISARGWEGQVQHRLYSKTLSQKQTKKESCVSTCYNMDEEANP